MNGLETGTLASTGRESLSHREQVFVAVDSIVGDRIARRLWSEIGVVRGYRLRQHPPPAVNCVEPRS